MIEKKTPGRVIFNICNYCVMALIAFVCVVPLWHVLMASISNPRSLMASSGVLLKPVGEVTLEGYRLVLKNKDILIGYANTLFYVLFTSVVGVAMTAVAGYLISRKNFKPARALTVFIVFTMMFSGGLIPTYMVIRGLNMINTRWAVMIPGIMSAFYIMMMKSSFEQLAEGYEESARLDGAGPLTILFRILLPLVKANLVVIILFNVLGQWNSWYPASIYLPRRRDYWPLQLFMREMLIQNDTARIITQADASSAADLVSNLVRYCVTIVGTAPILCAYPFAQKYFVTGITLGGVKG